jgi:hypothetical protein
MSVKIRRVTPREIAEMMMGEQAYQSTLFVTAADHDAEIERLRADAERFRWLSRQTALSLWTDPSEWSRDGQPFKTWGMISVNRRGYPAAETLAQLVDTARADQEDGR